MCMHAGTCVFTPFNYYLAYILYLHSHQCVMRDSSPLMAIPMENATMTQDTATTTMHTSVTVITIHKETAGRVGYHCDTHSTMLPIHTILQVIIDNCYNYYFTQYYRMYYYDNIRTNF